jgi:hypothetical protein
MIAPAQAQRRKPAANLVVAHKASFLIATTLPLPTGFASGNASKVRKTALF